MTRTQLLAGVAAGMVAVGLIFLFVLPAWLYHPLGVCSGRACGYQFWSGIAGSFLTSSGMWTGAFLLFWHSRCDTPGCLRHGRYRTADGHHRQCRVCHPDLPDHKPSKAEIHRLHHAAKVHHPPAIPSA